MQMHRKGNSYLGSVIFDLSYYSSITMQKLGLLVCIKVILKVHRHRRIFSIFFVHNREADVCVCAWREKVKEGGISVFFKTEVEKEVEEGVYIKASLYRQNVLDLLFVWIWSMCYSIFANMPLYVFSPKAG